MAGDISCPVSNIRIDNNVARISAGIVALNVIAALLVQSYLFFVLLAMDFGLRAFTNGKYSFIRALAIKFAEILELKKIPVDAAPKKFAAGLGLLFSAIIAVSFLSGSIILAYLAGTVLLLCALLEGVFSVCLGCHVYSLLVFTFSKHKPAAGSLKEI